MEHCFHTFFDCPLLPTAGSAKSVEPFLGPDGDDMHGGVCTYCAILNTAISLPFLRSHVVQTAWTISRIKTFSKNIITGLEAFPEDTQ